MPQPEQLANARDNDNTQTLIEALPPEHRDAILKRAEQVSPKWRKMYLRAMGGSAKADAIKAFCLECVAWMPDEVKACTAHACPLHPYRPYQ